MGGYAIPKIGLIKKKDGSARIALIAALCLILFRRFSIY